LNMSIDELARRQARLSNNRQRSSAIARHFLSTFDLNVVCLPSQTLHVLDYPGDARAFDQLKQSFECLVDEAHRSDLRMTSTIDGEPAATLVFLFLSHAKDLSMKVSHLTTYTSSEHPIIWLLLKDKHHPRYKEKIASIWEPLSNAQYYELRPTLRIGQDRWIGTRFTVGRQDAHELTDDNDIHMALTLSPQAQQRRSILL
jgi:hypothetical protein